MENHILSLLKGGDASKYKHDVEYNKKQYPLNQAKVSSSKAMSIKAKSRPKATTQAQKDTMIEGMFKTQETLAEVIGQLA